VNRATANSAVTERESFIKLFPRKQSRDTPTPDAGKLGE
jgi:hypothetical protein